MKLHLIGGFLGSGKTTAITTASKLLNEQGIIAAVITNDQGNYLVDSAFSNSLDIPTGQVTGGCFCCNYNDLDVQIDKLISSDKPQSVFAESVGSCTDLVATVLKPLQDKKQSLDKITFSVFVDSILLLSFLKGENSSFTDEIAYIFEKQIEEANILVVNKADLLSTEELSELYALIQTKLPHKTSLFQNSHNKESVEKWLNLIENYSTIQNKQALDIDYNIYGKGEADLAWLDEEVEIKGENAFDYTIKLIDCIYSELKMNNIAIGHLKFLVNNGIESQKISFTATSTGNNWKTALVSMKANKFNIMLNARAQTTPDNLRQIVSNIISEMNRIEGLTVNEYCVSYFKPGFPNPTYRYAS